ncbi:MAG TPA: ribonuclease HII [Terriglobia bacterium]|nr:ribonuclease HII [Terriglobia bacterium]
MRERAAKEFRCTRRFEAQLGREGWRLIAGCDEAGRGALIGPLYAAAVILDPGRRIRGVDDSKKLTPEVRASLDAEIRRSALAYQVMAVPAVEVDALNVYQASRRAMIRALRALVPAPDFVLTDAMRLSGWGDAIDFAIPHRSIVHGDARSASIAAASILAKVARDIYMVELDRRYPEYQLAKNKGYGTPEHLEGLARCGPCPEHRQTFQPVKAHSLPLFPALAPR